MMDNGKMIRKMEEGFIGMQMEMCMKEIGKTTKGVGMEGMNLLMGKVNMMESGRKI